jgi:hypothetical protein
MIDYEITKDEELKKANIFVLYNYNICMYKLILCIFKVVIVDFERLWKWWHLFRCQLNKMFIFHIAISCVDFNSH